MKKQYIGMRKLMKGGIFLALLSVGSASAVGAAWEWYGLGGGGTSYFDDPACWSKNSGVSPVSDTGVHYLTASQPQLTDKWDKRITFRENSAMNGRLDVELNFQPIVFEAEDPSYGITSIKNLLIYNDAELQINSGTYFFASLKIPSAIGGGALTLNGGELTVGGSSVWNDGLFVGNAATGPARLTVNGGLLKIIKYFTIGEVANAPGEVVINGDVVTNAVHCLTVGGNAPGICTIRKGGGYYCDNGGNMSLAVGSSSSGTLNIEGGEVLLGGYLKMRLYENGVGTINITDGGLLAMKCLKEGEGGAATLYIDGGTIRACADSTDSDEYIRGSSKLLIRVGPNGAIVDTAGHNIKIRETFIETGKNGHVAFVGGGVVQVIDPVYYSGITTIEAGTRLDFISEGDIANSFDRIFANGLVVTIPKTSVPVSGTEVLKLQYDGTIPDKYAVGDNLVVTGAPAESPNWRLAISDDRKSIVLVEDTAEAGEILTFTDDATVSGTEPVAAPVISVAAGKTATISSPVPGALRKVGAGTLTLASSRIAETALADGTLRFADGATVDPATLKLGVLPRVPVTFDYGGQTLNGDLGAYCSAHSDVTLVNGTFGTAGQAMKLPDSTLRFADNTAFQGSAVSLASQKYGRAEIIKDSGDWSLADTLSIGSADGSAAIFRHNGGSLTAKDVFVGNSSGAASALLEVNGGRVEGQRYFTIGERPDIPLARLVINNGTVATVVGSSYITVGGSSPGEMTVRKGGRHECKGMLVVASSASGTLNIEGGEVSVGGALRVCDNAYKDNNPATVNITAGGLLAFASLRYGVTSSTGKPAKFNIDGGTIRANSNNENFIPALEYVTFNAGTRGAVFDNAGYNITIAEDVSGSGTVTLSGSGTTTLAVSQTGVGAISVSEGTTLALTDGVTSSRRLLLSGGSTLKMPESGTVSLDAGMTLSDGATLKFAFNPNGASTLVCGKKTAVEGDSVAVVITGRDRPEAGIYPLTSGGAFAGKTVELAAGAPHWVKSVAVDSNGNIAANIVPIGLKFVIR